MADKMIHERCCNCILPSNYPNIVFDPSNTCNYCTSYKHQAPQGDNAFNDILQSTEEKAGAYHCLVPLSGGRDSTFVLYQLKHIHGLNVLAFNYDNGFTSSVARENVRRITDKLGVELVSLKSTQDIQAKHLRHVVKLNLRKSPAHVIAGWCVGCRQGIWGGACQVAKKYQIPLVVFGESSMESGTAKRIVGRQLRQTTSEKIQYAARMPVNFLLRKYFHTLLEREFPPASFSDIIKVNYFDYYEWDENKMLDVLYEKVDWQVESHMSTWRFDCKIHAVVNYMHKRFYGFTEKDELYSKMIRENQISREEALKKVASDPATDQKELAIVYEVLEKLRLTQKERQAVLNLETIPL